MSEESLKPSTPSEESRPATASADSDAPIRHSKGDVIDLRYRVRGTIGQGGMGAVYLVDDAQTGRELALKQIRRDRADSRSVLILKNEFLALAPLVHPNLARVYDFGFDWRTEEYYFTSEFVKGTQLLKATRALQLGEPSGLERMLDIMVQSLRGLEFVHSRGLVHGDLKPENLLLANDDGRLKIIDFGLTKREKDFGGKKVFGTSFYIAPETILGSQVDRRTDLYSLGVVFYHLLTRRLPFVGDSNIQILKGHLEESPKEPHRVNSSVPEALTPIVLKLMAKRPSDRYASAHEVIAEINKVCGTSHPLESRETLKGYLVANRYVGRDRTLYELRSYFHTAFNISTSAGEDDLDLSFLQDNLEGEGIEDLPELPSGRFLLVRGERGIGKSRLIQNLKRYGEVRGVPFLSFDIDPDKVARSQNLRDLLEALSRTFATSTAMQRDTMLQLFKLLVDSPPGRDGSGNDGALDRLACNLLSGCEKIPLVLAFSDLHLGEDILLRFLRVLVKNIAHRGKARAKILILAAARDEDLESPTLRRLLLSTEIRSHFREIALERLGEREFLDLIVAMLGKRAFEPRFVRRVFEESDGNPGVLQEILTFFIDESKLERTLSGWKYHGDIEKEIIPGKVRRDLELKIRKLDSDAKHLGLAFAFLGNSCELDIAARLAGIAPGKIIPAAVRLKRERLLREDGEGTEDRFSFSHQSAREIFKSLVSQKESETIHLRAGLLLEECMRSGVDIDPRRLAHHFLRAGNSEAGVRYGLMTARHFVKQQLPARALEVYHEVRELCADQLSGVLRDLDYQIAILESTVGNTQRSVHILRQLLRQSAASIEGGSGKITQADMLIELGIAECRLGHFTRAGRYLQEAYKAYKGAAKSAGLLRLLMGFATLFYYRADFTQSLRYCDRVESEVELLPNPLSRAGLHLLQAECYSRLDNNEKAADYCRRGLALLDGMKEAGAVAYSIFYLGKLHAYRGRFEKTQKQFQMAAKVYRRIHVRDLEADSLRESGAASLLTENPDRAKADLIRALDIYETTGHAWGAIETMKHLGESHRLLGRYEEAEAYLQSALVSNEKLGNPRRSWELKFVLARIHVDRGEYERATAFLQTPENTTPPEWLQHEEIVLSRLELQCRVALGQGEFRHALDLTARGMIHAREVRNRLRIAPLLELRARLHFLLGRFSEVERLVSELRDIGRRFNLPIITARADVLTTRAIAAAGDHDTALSRFEDIVESLRARESERELAEVYLEHGLVLAREGEVERSFLLFEEGAYLAKKLNLAHLRCRYATAMGELESRLAGGKLAQARNHFAAAERLARQHSFEELLWKVLHSVGKLLVENDQPANARGVLEESRRVLGSVLQKIPPAFHASYRELNDAHELDALHERVQKDAEPTTS